MFQVEFFGIVNFRSAMQVLERSICTVCSFIFYLKLAIDLSNKHSHLILGEKLKLTKPKFSILNYQHTKIMYSSKNIFLKNQDL